MPLARGRIQRNKLLDKLASILTTAPTGSNEPYWKAVQTGKVVDEGYILYSKGKSGKDDIYIRLYEGGTQYGYTYMSILESYKPNPVLGLNGTIIGESPKATVEFCNAQYSSYPLTYFLSFDKDKIMLSLAGDPVYHSYAVRTLAWAGMPERLSDEPNSNAVTIACSRRAGYFSTYTNMTTNSNGTLSAYTLKNRKYLSGQGGGSGTGYSQDSIYRMSVASNYKSKGWGDKITLFPIHLDRSDEGYRSLMAGVYPIYQDLNNRDFLDGDEITIGSKRYSVFLVSDDFGKVNNPTGGSYSTNCFPSIYMAVEHLS